MPRRSLLALALAAPAAWPQPVNAQAWAVAWPSDWPLGRSPEGFWVSEKLDGVRAVWDGQTLRFRSGRVIAGAPESFLRALPAFALDGELWLARGQFDRLSGLVRQAWAGEAAWRQVQYRVFDAPGRPGDFQTRWAELQGVIHSASLPWLQAVEQWQCDSAAQLQRQLDALVSQGAEGLILHRADAPWRAGRSQALFKLKPEPDEDAVVVGHLPGQGRDAGLTGALLLETAEGLRFALGSGLSQALRREPPPLGTWVTYRYRGHTSAGVPRFASFLRIRPPE